MTEELKQLQQAIEWLEGGPDSHTVHFDAVELVKHVINLINKPSQYYVDSVASAVEQYQETWINWKAKQ